MSSLVAPEVPTDGDGFVAKAIIFDIDGTLCNSWKLGFSATQTVLGRDITEGEYHAGTCWSTPERLARHAGLKPEDAEFAREGARLGQLFDDLYIAQVSPTTACLFNGIKPLLWHLSQQCDRVRIGALTNAAVAYAHAVLQTNEIHKIFSTIHGADDVPAPKPSSSGLLQICEDLGGISPTACIFVGDSPSDGAAGKAAGMETIGCCWGSHPRATLTACGHFDEVIDRVDELQPLLDAFLKRQVYVHTSSLGAAVGHGLFAAHTLPGPGFHVCDYTGTVYTSTREATAKADHSYLMRLGPQKYVDALEHEEVVARFINDCKNASLHNVKFVKLPGENKAKVVTLRPILPGEELFVDYGKWYWAGFDGKPIKLSLSATMALLRRVEPLLKLRNQDEF
jgi:phosphoglycolate phosphatase-like HAD superfamily hydrolase